MTTDLTAARIRRANRSIDQETAQMLADELRVIIAAACAYCEARWKYSDDDREYLTQMMVAEILDDHPPGDYDAYHAACVTGDFEAARLTDYNAAGNASEFLATELTDLYTAPDLFQRYMRL